MDVNNSKFKLSTIFILSLSISSCSLTSPEIPLKAFNDAEQALGEWGSAAASAPIISQATVPFLFELDKDANDFYKNAKEEVNAGIAQHSQTVMSFMLAASTQSDSVNKAKFQSELEAYNEKQHAKTQKPTELSVEEKQFIEEQRNFLLKQAESNYEACVSAADNELEAAKAETDTAKKAQLNTDAIERRNKCLSDYQAILFPAQQVSNVSYPSIGENNVPALSRLQAVPFQAKSSLSDNLHKKEDSAFTHTNAIPDHQAIGQAATNHFLNATFQSLSKSEGDSFFGVSMVSVNPGWRTREGYKAVLNIRPTVSFQKASLEYTMAFLNNEQMPEKHKAVIAMRYGISCEGFSFKSECGNAGLLNEFKKLDGHQEYSRLKVFEKKLAATAISPVAYGQTLDLQSKQISQFNFSLMLAASLRNAGAEQAAEIFADFSKQQRQEFSSRNLRNHVNVFSHNNSLLGVEIAPEFFAANEYDSDPEEILQAQTFPMLIRFQSRELAPLQNVIAMNCNNRKDTADFCLLEPVLKMRTTNRWMPIKPNFLNIAWLPNKVTLTTEDLFNIKVELDKYCDALENRKNENSKPIDDVKSNLVGAIKADSFMQGRCDEIHNKLFGVESYTSLPPKKTKQQKPSIDHVYPQQVVLSLDDKNKIKPVTKEFIISGKVLNKFADGNTTDVTSSVKTIFGGQSVSKAELKGGSIAVEVKVTENKGPVIFRLQNKQYDINGGSKPEAIVQLITKAKMKSTPKEAPVYKLSIDEKGNQVILPIGEKDLPKEVSALLQSTQQSGNSTVLSKLEGICGVLITQNPNKVFDLGGCEKLSNSSEK